MLTNSPFEFFADCVGLVLIIIFSIGAPDDVQRILSRWP